MVGQALAVLRWQALRLHRRRGWPLWAGALLAALVAWFGCQAWLLGNEARRLATLRSDAPRVEPARPGRPVTEDELKRYYEALPHEGERFTLVKRLLLAAEKNGVRPQQADYKLEAEPLTRVVRYQVTLPLKGDFGRIQAFVADALNENRSVAIDAFSARREAGEHGEVEARVQFSVLMSKW